MQRKTQCDTSDALQSSMRSKWNKLAFAILALATGHARFYYQIKFVACTDLDCQEKSMVEQHAPWKYVKDGECKSFHDHDHAFPGWAYTYVGKPSGRACPRCPEAFGSCTIDIYEKTYCTGKLYNRLNFVCLEQTHLRMSLGLIIAGKLQEQVGLGGELPRGSEWGACEECECVLLVRPANLMSSKWAQAVDPL